MKKFKSGDVVVLKSGGELMTVKKVTKKGNVHCVWYATAFYDTCKFNQSCLKKAKVKGN